MDRQIHGFILKIDVVFWAKLFGGGGGVASNFHACSSKKFVFIFQLTLNRHFINAF